jgi:CRISPR system Cascade subunit CasA
MEVVGMTKFNLVEEQWIPVRRPGSSELDFLGLRDTLVYAHEFDEIFDPSPMAVVALHRLLLAILHRNVGPESHEAWCSLWRLGRWDEGVIDSYFERVGKYFDLFDRDRPFYQVPAMNDTRTQPIQRLVMGLASGNNATLFDHRWDSTPITLTSAEAARSLLVAQGFSIGFGKSNPFYLADAPLTRGVSVLVTGRNLFETLALNLIGEERLTLPRNRADCPIWERDTLPTPDPRGTQPAGYLDYLTWQSRRIHLFPEGDPPKVTGCQIQQGLKLASGALTFDPFKAYRRDETRGYVPLGLDADRALWRDSHALLQRVDDSSKRPGVIEWLAVIDDQRRFGRIDAQSTFDLSVFGFGTEFGKAASIKLWRHDRLPLPLVYVQNANLVEALDRALEQAKRVGDVLKSAIRLLARRLVAPDSDDPNRRQPRREDVAPVFDSLAVERLYWPRLEPAFRSLLIKLPNDSSAEDGEISYGGECLPRWGNVLHKVASDAFEKVVNGLATSPRARKAIAQAEAQFRASLNGVVSRNLPDEERG